MPSMLTEDVDAFRKENDLSIVDDADISVIIVVKDCVGRIRQTIDSALYQAGVATELVVIDAVSTDGTTDILESYRSKLSILVSEPDNGIYDAMNKGVRLSRGQWILFLNCGDTFHNEHSLSALVSDQTCSSSVGIVYGSVFSERRRKLIRAKPPHRIPYGMVCSHQSMICKRSLLLDNPFDQHLVAADFGFLVKLYFDRVPIISRPEVTVTNNMDGGVSDVQQQLIVSEWRQIAFAYQHTYGIYLHYSVLSLKVRIKQTLRGMVTHRDGK